MTAMTGWRLGPEPESVQLYGGPADGHTLSTIGSFGDRPDVRIPIHAAPMPGTTPDPDITPVRHMVALYRWHPDRERYEYVEQVVS